MAARPQPAAMSADEFRTLFEAAGLTEHSAAALLGVHASTVHRWINGDAPIADDKARLIRTRLKHDGA